MPYLKATTSLPLDDAQRHRFLENASRAVASLTGKSENYVMVTVEDRAALRFAGSGEPCCYLEMKSIGFPDGDTTAVSRGLCELVERELGIPAERTFIEFVDVPRPMWGWNGKTFA